MIAAAELLASDWAVSAEIFSVTSFSELAKDAREVERWNRLNPSEPSRLSQVARLLPGPVPVVAATDYVSALPQMIAPHLDARYVVLGTDGFGRSDTRAALRSFFEVDRHQIVLAALDALARSGGIARAVLKEAITKYGIDAQAPAPWTV